ncbi:MAG: glutaredoxin family protein [Oleiphilaceae bacterium]|nr:glutaredoxin family protein [Oleiphilaceae bacterium]
MELQFYTTSHCQLCDLAEHLLIHTPLAEPMPVDAIDIAESEALVNAYGTRIPVLRRTDTGAELDWPFDQNQLLAFLEP